MMKPCKEKIPVVAVASSPEHNWHLLCLKREGIVRGEQKRPAKEKKKNDSKVLY